MSHDRPMAPPRRRLPAGLHLATLLLAGGLLAGCGQNAPSEGYFPLKAGHRWVYQQTSEWENQTREREELLVTTEGEGDLPQGGSGLRRRSHSGMTYWLRQDASGTYRVASKTDLQAEPEPDTPHRYVLKAPLAVGSSWQASTTAYLLRRNAEFPPEIRHTHAPVTMTYQIAALDEAVQTRAGSFTNCLRVEGTAAMRLFADPVVGFRDMPLLTTEWYCKDVGLVKLLRREPANNSTFLKGGTFSLELIEWQ